MSLSVYESDHVRLVYRATGAELPVVFLHPTPLNHNYWQLLADRLVGVRFLMPDLRGHGDSSLGPLLPVGEFAAVPDAPVLTMAQLAKDVLILLDHLQIPAAVFAGCSIGGYVLLEIYRQAPERVRGLAFVCSKPQPDTEAHQERRVQTIARVRLGESSALFAEMAQNLIGATSREAHPDLVGRVLEQMTLTPEALIAVQAGLATRPDSLPTVAQIQCPVLAVAGGEDPGVTADEMRAFQDAPGGCSFHLLPNVGHLAAMEDPDAVANIFANWLRQFELF